MTTNLVINRSRGIDQKTGKPLDYDPSKGIQVYDVAPTPRASQGGVNPPYPKGLIGIGGRGAVSAGGGAVRARRGVRAAAGAVSEFGMSVARGVTRA